MSTREIILSGFGGQGILFIGKILAYKGMVDGQQVSWFPSYGPEMRGGAANCSIVLSDEPIGSPLVRNPDILVAMNNPALEKFEKDVVPGGMIFIDSTLVTRPVERTDIKLFAIPATKIASDNDMPTLANMILFGKILSGMGDFDEDSIKAALGKVISAKHADMLELNLKAMKIGQEYEG